MLFRDGLYGFMVVIAVMGCEFLVKLFYAEPAGLSLEQHTQYINQGYLYTALPAALVTFLLAGLLKTKNIDAALQRSIIWTVMVALTYAIVGLVNHNFIVLFTNRGIFALLFCIFCGPMLYAAIKHRKAY